MKLTIYALALCGGLGVICGCGCSEQKGDEVEKKPNNNNQVVKHQQEPDSLEKQYEKQMRIYYQGKRDREGWNESVENEVRKALRSFRQCDKSEKVKRINEIKEKNAKLKLQ